MISYLMRLEEQGRNFNNKIWNSFRLIQGWEVSDTLEQEEAQKAAIQWFEQLLDVTRRLYLLTISKSIRINDATLLMYKLFKDDFSGTYLELIKPPYGQPIDRATCRRPISSLSNCYSSFTPLCPLLPKSYGKLLRIEARGESTDEPAKGVAPM